MKDASPGAGGTVSESGWSNMQVSCVPWRSDSKTLVLLDGHRSHVALVLAEWAKQNNIILFVLPAHTSHLLQPLDVACYGPSNVSTMHSPTNSCAKHQQQSPNTTYVNLHVTSTPGLCHLKTCKLASDAPEFFP